VTPPPVHEPGFYHAVLTPLSESIDIWETEYLQVLEGENPVKEWTEGYLANTVSWTSFRATRRQPSRQPMVSASRKPTREIAAGQTLFPFRRLFMVVQRKG
jgi:Trans-aconitate methyltransferase